jgi:hypothetical protein
MKKANDKDINLTTNKNNNNLFCYEVDDKRIVIESGIQMEILEKSTVYPIPNAPKWYSGVTSLRGNILTVINMHFLLNAKQSIKPKRLLKLKHPDFQALVIAIDNLPYQSNVNELVNNKNNNNYPAWIISFSKHHQNIFLFADHATLFRAMQATIGDSQ